MPYPRPLIRRCRLAALPCLLLVLAGIGPPLPTFVGPANVDPARPELTGADLPLIVEKLSLDRRQSAAVARLLDRYVADFAALVKQHAPAAAGAGYAVEGGAVTESQGGDEQSGDYSVSRSDRDPLAEPDAAPEDVSARTRAFRWAVWELRRDLLEAIKAETGAAESPRWLGLERALVRRQTLPRGRLDGERTNLIAIVDGLDLDASAQAKLQTTLEEYEQALHHALLRRNAFVSGTDVIIHDALREREAEKALSIVDREVRLRMEVRDVNRRFRDEIADRLDPAAATAFLREVRATSFPRVYRKTRAKRAFEEARRRDGLDPLLRAEIDELERVYLAELATVNASLRRLVEADQVRAARRELLRLIAEASGEEDPPPPPEASPLRDGFRRRYELDARYMNRLRALVAPEQVTTPPPTP